MALAAWKKSGRTSMTISASPSRTAIVGWKYSLTGAPWYSRSSRRQWGWCSSFTVTCRTGSPPYRGIWSASLRTSREPEHPNQQRRTGDEQRERKKVDRPREQRRSVLQYVERKAVRAKAHVEAALVGLGVCRAPNGTDRGPEADRDQQDPVADPRGE